MKRKKSNLKKVLYIVLLVVLGLIFVSSLAFGVIGAFFEALSSEIEVWYMSKTEKEISLLSTSVKWLIASALLLITTLSFKDLKKKYID